LNGSLDFEAETQVQGMANGWFLVQPQNTNLMDGPGYGPNCPFSPIRLETLNLCLDTSAGLLYRDLHSYMSDCVFEEFFLSLP